MLCGVPGAGKSTWIKSQNFDMSKTVIVSTDNYIEYIARMTGRTYNEVFKDVIKLANTEMNHSIELAIKDGKDIVWDQTNTTVSGREVKIARISKHYKKIAVVFPTPEEDEHSKRLDSRPGKTIPQHVLKSMISGFEVPTLDEGFAEISVVYF